MKFIIKLFPEIALKSTSVRKRFTRILSDNIRNTLRKTDENIAVLTHWDYIEVRCKNPELYSTVCERLSCISGIHHFLEVEEVEFTDLHDIYQKTYERYQNTLSGHSFCVRIKRKGKHDFNSLEAARYIGGHLHQSIENVRVDLTNPDIVILLQIHQQKLQFIKKRHDGLGGFPMGTQESVLSLISGGFDSGVASFLFIRRGIKVHYLFFNMGGSVHELGVKQMAYHLWQKYGISHRVKFIAVDFEPVVAQILQNIDDGQMGVILKRLMVKIASEIATRLKIPALVTGEAVGQVASQTLINLNIIDKASQTVILRPLIAHDKEEIIKLSEQIGTDKIAASMPEFCGVISKSPTVCANETIILENESRLDPNIIHQTIERTKIYDIKDLIHKKQIIIPDIVYDISKFDAIIDIRTEDEIENNPLPISNIPVLPIPFYRLASIHGMLNKDKFYGLYCAQGVMSKLQAAHLLEQGFRAGVFKINP